MASYRKKHIKHKIHTSKLRKPILSRFWFWAVVGMALLIGLLVYLLFFYPGLQVNRTTISGNQQVQQQALLSAVNFEINRASLQVGGIKIPAKNILLFSTASLEKTILQNFPQIGQVIVTRQLPQSISVRVQERTAVAVYCSGNTSCFLIDGKGIAFATASAGDNTYFIVRQTPAGSELVVNPGQAVIKPANIAESLLIAKKLKDSTGVSLREVSFQPEGQIIATTAEGWKIYFATEQGSGLSVELAQLTSLFTETISPDSRKNLQYIDLRFTNRAYYK